MSGPASAHTGARRSRVWNYFTKSINGEAQCDTCQKIFSPVSGGSTSNLIKHLKSRHKDLLHEYFTVKDDVTMKEEYIVLQGAEYDQSLDEDIKEDEVGENSHYQIIPNNFKKQRVVYHMNNSREHKPAYETLKSSVTKDINEPKNEEEAALEIFSKYMVSLMKGMPTKKCEETQLKILSVIMEAKREYCESAEARSMENDN